MRLVAAVVASLLAASPAAAYSILARSLGIESSNGKEVTVDAVRDWMSTLPYGSLFSNWSVKIINELDRCSKDAQDILLSYLDRLPPGKALIGTSNLSSTC